MSKKLNILFATVYGNAENVANNINKIAIEKSFVSQVNAKQISPRLECDGDRAGSDAWAESFIDMIK